MGRGAQAVLTAFSGIFWSCGVEILMSRRTGWGGWEAAFWGLCEGVDGGMGRGLEVMGGYVGEISSRHTDVADFANTEGKSYAKAVNLA